MIHIFVGTKAQFIKMAPVMRELDRRKVKYNFIDAGQHAGITRELIRDFKLREPDVRLRRESTDINTVGKAFWWALASMLTAIFLPKRVFQQVFLSQEGICLIHGDTLTTLLSLFYARRCNITVAHVEAGLRSYNLLNPFPEELIRLVAMRFSHILFAPSEGALENLTKMGYASKSVLTNGNTIIDAISYVRGQLHSYSTAREDFILATLHRAETVFSRKRLTLAVNFLIELSSHRQLIFVLHTVTSSQIERHRLLERLKQAKNIKLESLLPYARFIELISHANLVVTDGGSIQEECYALNRPCLILRDYTERSDGLGENAVLSHFEISKALQLLSRDSLQKKAAKGGFVSPSEKIADYILQYA